MDKDRVTENLACVDGHFHSEAKNVAAALEIYTDDIFFEAGVLNWSFAGKQEVAKFYREP